MQFKTTLVLSIPQLLSQLSQVSNIVWIKLLKRKEVILLLILTAVLLRCRM